MPRQRKVQRGLWIGGLATLLILQFSALESGAGIIGNPVSSGRSTTTLSQLHLEFDQLELDIDSGTGGFDGQSTSERILFKGVYGATPFLDISIRFGVSDFETPSREFTGDLGPAFGIGFRRTFYEKGDFRLGAGAQFLTFETRDTGPTPRLRYSEFETFVGGALTGLERVSAYFGILISKGYGNFRNGPTIRSNNPFGLFLGGEFQIYDRYYFSGEARVINENALTVSLSYRL
ncbi:MAG: hypothetical protein ACE5HN_07885 [Nitrospiria bacterium]